MIESADTDLPEPELADDGDDLAAADVEAQALDRPHDAARGLEMDVQILDLEQRRGPLRSDQHVRLRFHPQLGDFRVLIRYLAPAPYT